VWVRAEHGQHHPGDHGEHETSRDQRHDHAAVAQWCAPPKAALVATQGALLAIVGLDVAV
jgi:hypothetical protein